MNNRMSMIAAIGLSFSVLSQAADKTDKNWELIQRTQGAFEKSDAATDDQGSLVLQGRGCKAVLTYSDRDMKVVLTKEKEGSSTFTLNTDDKASFSDKNGEITARAPRGQSLRLKLSNGKLRAVDVGGVACGIASSDPSDDKLNWELIQRTQSAFEKSATDDQGNLVLQGLGCKAVLTYSDRDMKVVVSKNNGDEASFTLPILAKIDSLDMRNGITARTADGQSLNIKFSGSIIKSVAVPRLTCKVQSKKASNNSGGGNSESAESSGH